MSAELWDAADLVAQIDEPPQEEVRVPIQRRRRRGFEAEELDSRSALELTRDREGVLRWVYRPPLRQARTGRRVYSAAGIDQPEVVKRFRFEDLQPNDVTKALQDLDAKLNPSKGVRAFAGGQWQDAIPAEKDATLLLVHGTFSKAQMFTDELAATPEGQALLARWQANYGRILGFEHPTLSVGPWYNALDLVTPLAAMKGPVDIVCHSRGGLVVGWLLRLAKLPVRKVTFVGSPLAGTSLASPHKLRAALDLLANYADAIGTVAGAASLAVPLAAGAAGIARIFGKTLRLGSSLPITDAAVALVPGLAAQQHTSNNLELLQLFAEDWKTQPALQGVGANFMPSESAQGWKFWRRFTNVGSQLAYSAADLVFQDQNDLVVDVGSMAGPEGDPVPFQFLGTGPTTHHCSYFRDPRVLKLL